MFYLTHHDGSFYTGHKDMETCDFNDTAVWEIMQYTGLKDKNGKEIYEGDVLILCNRKRPGEYYTSTPHFCKWHEGKFTMRSIKYNTDIDGWSENCQLEIIGNIYGNKELLREPTEVA